MYVGEFDGSIYRKLSVWESSPVFTGLPFGQVHDAFSVVIWADVQNRLCQLPPATETNMYSAPWLLRGMFNDL